MFLTIYLSFMQQSSPVKLSLDPKMLLTEDLLDLLGVGELSGSERTAMMSTILDTIQNRVLVRILDFLSTDEIDAFESALKKNDTEKMEEILSQGGLPSFAQIAVEEALLYKTELVNELSS